MHAHTHTDTDTHTNAGTQKCVQAHQKNSWTHTIDTVRQRQKYVRTPSHLSLPSIHSHKQTLLHTFTSSHTHARPHMHNRRPLIVRLSNNHDALSWGALAGFAFHTSLLFKDTQGREWNHLSQREAQRLEAPPAEKPVYFGWQNTLGYGCVCIYVRVYARVCFGVRPVYPLLPLCAPQWAAVPMY